MSKRKKKSKLLIAAVWLIVIMMLISVLWVAFIYLNPWSRQAHQTVNYNDSAVQNAVENTAISITGTDENGNTVVVWDSVETDNAAAPDLPTQESDTTDNTQKPTEEAPTPSDS